ncbi:hypothetical protein ACS0TY_005220 [Phlomoides rotata]
MKSKLAASFRLYFADTCWRNTRSTMPARSMISFNCRHCQISCSFQAKGFESSSRAAHSSADNDVFSDLGPASECPTKKIKLATEKPDDFVEDDFSELGPEISECSAKKIKLVTEKPDHFTKTRPRRKESPRRPLSSDNRTSVNEILPSSTDDAGKVSDIEGPLSVSIKNVPSAVGLTELVEAISIFGKVSHASFVTASNKIRCCNIEFEDVESSRKAIVTGEVTVGNRVFTIDRLDAVDLVMIRIKNISDKTTDYDIHSICKSVGELVGLTMMSKDCADAFFYVPNHSTHLDIVKKLNGTTIDLNRWLATSKSTSLDEEARYKTGLMISDRVFELKRELDMKKVHLADLEYLNASVMHMEWNPSGSR